jgi:MinD-like ATPase involved in chromosome partitioning or flagellar assembly/tetratricopeptide (TPR) repeat protein
MIYTFYSFKGGVGRSMALANVAELLYRRGSNVLIVDFDLEAPGLEGYFNTSEAEFSPNEIQGKRGVIDLILSYSEMRSLPAPKLPQSENLAGSATPNVFPYPVEPLSNFVVPIYKPSAKGGSLSIVPAGARKGDEFTHYAQSVRAFDWDDFYTNLDGELFFEWFRHEAESMADYVLVDSRTGVTEMSGVCTYQLADVVAMFVSPNQQNLDGTLMMARSLSNPELIEEGRKGRPLSLVFVPSRVEQGDAELLDKFANEFDKTLGRYIVNSLIFEKSAFIDLKIPYIAHYAFMERVAAREPERASSADLIEAFERLVSALQLHGSENEQAEKLYNKALIWRDEPKEKEKAIEAIERAVVIWEKLTKNDLKLYGLNLARAKKLLSELLEEDDEQRSTFVATEAKNIYYRLYKADPNTFGENVAMGLAEIAYHLYETDTKEAIETLRKATNVHASSVESEDFAAERARWLYDLSNWFIEEEQFSDGLATIQEAVPAYRNLYAVDSTQFASDLADSLITLSECSLETGDMSSAIANGQEAVDFYKQLALRNRRRYEAGLVKSYNALLDTLSRAEINRVLNGLEIVQEAVRLFRNLAELDPKRYEADLAKCLNMLPDPLLNKHHVEEALKAQQEAIDIFRNLRLANPAQYDPELALSLISLSTLLSNNNDEQGARNAALEAIEILEQLSKDSPSRYKEDLKEAIGLANRQSKI